jgi:hypothetical protein
MARSNWSSGSCNHSRSAESVHSLNLENFSARFPNVKPTQKDDNNSNNDDNAGVSPNEKYFVSLSRDYRMEITKELDKVAKLVIILQAVKEVSSEVGKGRIRLDPMKTRTYRCGKIAACVSACHNRSASEFIRNSLPSASGNGLVASISNMLHVL